MRRVFLCISLSLLAFSALGQTPTPTPIFSDNDSNPPATWSNVDFSLLEGTSETTFGGSTLFTRVQGLEFSIDFPVPAPGYYDFAMFLPNPSNSPNLTRSDSGNITVSHGSFSGHFLVNFRVEAQWHSFGTFLVLDDSISAGFVVDRLTHFADAFRLQPVNFKPSVTLTHNAESVITADASLIEVTATFSEPVTFTQNMLAIEGGSVQDFDASSDSVYVFTIQVDENREEPFTAEIAAEQAADETVGIFALLNSASNNLEIDVDTKRPTPILSFEGEVANVLNREFNNFFGFVTFDEDVTDFESSDIEVEGGFVVAFNQIDDTPVYSFAVQAETDSTDDITVSVDAGVAFDENGNANAESNNTLTVLVDTVTPTVALTHSMSSDVNSLSPPSTITFEFSEDVESFTIDKITSTNAVLSNFSSSSAQTYSVIVTPATGVSSGDLSVSVAEGACTDLNGNPNAASTNDVLVSIETSVPTALLSQPVESSVQPGDMVTSQTGEFFIRLTFSEVPSLFETSQVNVTGGRLTRASQDELQNIFTLRLEADESSTEDLVVQVLAGAAEDGAGNPNPASNVLTISVDTAKPTVVLSLDPTPPSIINASTSAMTLNIALSEPVEEFSLTNVEGATMGELQGSGTSFSVLLTPLADSTTTLRVEIPADQLTDLNGNPNIGSNIISQAVDTVFPSVTVTTSAVATVFDITTSTPAVTVSFQFSEAVVGFSLDAITYSGGTLENLRPESPSLYLADLSVPFNSTESVVITVPAGATTDLADNAVTAGGITLTVNTQDPRYTILRDGSQVQCSFPFPETCASELTIANPTITVAVSLTEPVSNFDMTVTGATKAIEQQSDLVYLITITPPANSVEDVVIRSPPVGCDPCPVDVDTNILPTAEMTFATDLRAPLASVSHTWGTCNSQPLVNWATRTASVHVTFDESVAFESDPPSLIISPAAAVELSSVANVTATGFDVSVTVAAGFRTSENLVVSVEEAMARDGLTNPNAAQLALIDIPLDTQRPTVDLVSSFAGTTAVSKFTRVITVEGTFSEDVIAFDQEALRVSGATVTSFAFEEPRSMTVVVTVLDDSQERFVFALDDDVVSDSQCNGNQPASLEYSVDTTTGGLEVELVLHNVTQVSNTDSLRSAIAAPIEGVSRDSVTILSVQSTTQQKNDEESTRVVSAIILPEGADKEATANTFYSSASNGELADFLSNEGISGLSRVEISSIKDESNLLFERPLDEGGDDGLSTPLISVLAVVIFFFVILFVFLAYVFKKMVEKMQDVEEKNIERENSHFASELMNNISGEGGAHAVFKMNRADSHEGSDRFLELQDQSFHGTYHHPSKSMYVSDPGFGGYGHGGMSPSQQMFYPYSGQSVSQDFQPRQSFAEGGRPSFQEPPLMVAFSEEEVTPRRQGDEEDELGPEIAATLRMLEENVGDLIRDQDKPEQDLDSVLQLLERDVGEISRLADVSDGSEALRDAISGVLTRSNSRAPMSSGKPRLTRVPSRVSEKSSGSHARKPSSGGGSLRGITLTPRSGHSFADSDLDASLSDRRHMPEDLSTSELNLPSGISSGSDTELGHARIAQPLPRPSPRGVIEFEDEEQEGH